MDKPTKVLANGKEYAINTDFRVAIECNKIAMDTDINDYERALAVIYKLFGDNGLNDKDNWKELLRLAQVYLSCGKEVDKTSQKEMDMDFEQDFDYIEASFMSDYNIDLSKSDMHWWTFYNLINGLSNSELGSCCILNRVRNIRNFDTSKIKDANERAKIEEAKRQVALKKKNKPLTAEQQASIDLFNKLAGL